MDTPEGEVFHCRLQFPLYPGVEKQGIGIGANGRYEQQLVDAIIGRHFGRSETHRCNRLCRMLRDYRRAAW